MMQYTPSPKQLNQDGKMDKSLKQMAASTHEALKEQKALQSLAASQVTELPKMISTMESTQDEPAASSSLSISDAKDITAEFLAPATKCDDDVPNSDIVVYKGLVRRLSGMKPSTSTIAVLAGRDKFAGTVVVGYTLEGVLEIR